MKRLLRHLFAPSARRMFPSDALERITAAIADSERSHSGEICFAVEAALDWRAVLAGESPRERAAEVFAQLGVWDTAANNGVLLYLLLADHRIEIVADRGLDGLVTAGQWQDICDLMRERIRAGEPEAAVLQAVAAIDAMLREHFPRQAHEADEDELPNRPHLL